VGPKGFRRGHVVVSASDFGGGARDAATRGNRGSCRRRRCSRERVHDRTTRPKKRHRGHAKTTPGYRRSASSAIPGNRVANGRRRRDTCRSAWPTRRSLFGSCPSRLDPKLGHFATAGPQTIGSPAGSKTMNITAKIPSRAARRAGFEPAARCLGAIRPRALWPPAKTHVAAERHSLSYLLT
jgi:hypothetical protein